MAEYDIFDRNSLRLHRDRAANNSSDNFLQQEVSKRISERFDGEIKGDFPNVLNLGSGHGYLTNTLRGKAGINQIINTDISESMLNNSDGLKICCDEENLPFTEGKFDIVTSCLSLHNVNDIPGCLIQAKKSLRKGGLFLATIFGGNTLKELRDAFAMADDELYSGISPHISPFVHVKDAGQLLQRAGFSLPVADSEEIRVVYKDAFALMGDLKKMGETNILKTRKKGLSSPSLLEKVATIYAKNFSNADGNIESTFEIITLTGWND